MSKGYTHEGTPVLVSHDGLQIYHSGTTILTMYSPRTNKWCACKRWGGVKILDNKTDFTTEGFMMFNWDEIVNKDLVVTKEYSTYTIDLEALEKGSRYVNAVLKHHDFLVDEETVKNYEPIKCEFDANNQADFHLDGVELSTPARWRAEFTFHKWSAEHHRSDRIKIYDPALKVQSWHEETMENIRTAMKLYEAAIPNIPVRYRNKKKVV